MYRAVMENTHFGFTLIDRNYKIVLVNSLLCSYFHKPANELIGRECFREFEKRGSICPHCPGKLAMAADQPAEVETEKVRDDGSRFPVCIQAFPTFDSDGAVDGFIEITEDITERKNMEEALRRNEARYRSSIELTGQLAWTTDSNGEVVEDIPLWRKFTGLSYEETKGSGWTKALHPEDAEHTRQVWGKAVKDKKAYEVEFRLRRFDGVYRDFLTRGIPVFKEDGSIREWVGVNIDITERKKAEEVLQETTSYLENLFNYANAPIIVWNPSFKITRFNHAFERLTGYAAKEIIGQKLTILFPKASKDKSLVEIEHTLKGEYWKTVEIPILCKDRSIRVALWNSANIYGKDGKTLIATIAQGIDITEARRIRRP